MRSLYVLLIFLLCGCSDAGPTFDVHVRRGEGSLVGRISASEKICIVTYKMYYNGFGVSRHYENRTGIDIAGECEIDVSPGETKVEFNILDKDFARRTSKKRICVDITYRGYGDDEKTVLRRKGVCE